MMIRITADSTNGLRLIVEGKLTGAAAARELRNECAGRGPGVVLDLAGVVFADRAGAELLKELRAAGVTLERCSSFMKELLN